MKSTEMIELEFLRQRVKHLEKILSDVRWILGAHEDESLMFAAERVRCHPNQDPVLPINDLLGVGK